MHPLSGFIRLYHFNIEKMRGGFIYDIYMENDEMYLKLMNLLNFYVWNLRVSKHIIFKKTNFVMKNMLRRYLEQNILNKNLDF